MHVCVSVCARMSLGMSTGRRWEGFVVGARGEGGREANPASKEVGSDARVMRTHTAPGFDNTLIKDRSRREFLCDVHRSQI